MLKPLFFSAAILLPSASMADHHEGLTTRSATDQEMSYCDHDRDLSGQTIFIGKGSNKKAPLELLICSTSDVWQMDCEYAKILKEIFDFSINHPELGGAAQNSSKNLETSLSYCNNLFLS